MRYTMMLTLLALSACADVPVLTSPEEQLADRAAHDAYLAQKYDPEYLANCESHVKEECE